MAMMWFRLGMAIGGLCACSIVLAKPVCTAATELTPRLCTVKLPSIRQVSVLDAPAGEGTTSPNGAADCNRFRLTPQLVRRYLANARQVADPRGESAVDRSPCAVAGKLVWADGQRADWRIDQMGTATLVRSTGAEPITLYCPGCRFAPFRR